MDDALGRLGAALQEARHSRGLELSVLAAQLRMGEAQLHALETADPDRLPEPVFVIAQARRVAAHLGVDLTPLLDDVKSLNRINGQAPVPPTALMPSAARETARSASTPAIGAAATWAGGALLLAGVIAAGVWSWPRLQQFTSQLQSQAPTPPAETAPAKSAAPAGSAAPTRPEQAVLSLRSTQPSWLEVRDRTDRVLFRGNLKGERRFALNQPIRVLAGRPDLVMLSVGGGAARPLGRIEEIRFVTIQPPAARQNGNRGSSAAPISAQQPSGAPTR